MYLELVLHNNLTKKQVRILRQLGFRVYNVDFYILPLLKAFNARNKKIFS